MPTSDKRPAPKFYDVPAGTPASQCRGSSCRAIVYWIENPDTGRRIPIDCEVEGGEEPSARDDGRGVSHFTTCTDVRQFSRKA